MGETTYQEAMNKLEIIMKEIENEKIDVDELSNKVKEAMGLITKCKEKIEKAEIEIKRIG